MEESRKSYSDEFVSRLQKSVEKIKFDREFGRRYMLVEELMKEEYNAGKEDGKAEGIVSSIVDFLSDLSPVSDDLESRIASVNDFEILKNLNKKAARATSIEEFEQYLTVQNY